MARPMQAWSGYHDPVRRRVAAAGAHRPPLPLTERQALDRAVHLRELGMNGRSIAIVLAHYHGHWAHFQTWNSRIRRALTSTPSPDTKPCPRCDRGSVTGPNGEHWRCAYCNGTGQVPA